MAGLDTARFLRGGTAVAIDANRRREYEPATGTYVGPDGRTHTRADLATDAPKDKTWQ
jgi:hypothetical protein